MKHIIAFFAVFLFAGTSVLLGYESKTDADVEQARESALQICGYPFAGTVYDVDGGGDSITGGSQLCLEAGAIPVNFFYDSFSNYRSWTCIGGSVGGDDAWCYVNERFCGDDIITGPETCDDGNSVSGDGCSSVCMIEENSCVNDYLSLDFDQNGVVNSGDLNVMRQYILAAISTFPNIQYADMNGDGNITTIDLVLVAKVIAEIYFPDICADGIDNNCDGNVDEGC